MAGMAYRLMRRGIPTADIAQLLEMNRRTVSTLRKELTLEGVGGVAELLPCDDGELVAVFELPDDNEAANV